MEENKVQSKSVAAEREEKILAFWNEQNIFQKSLQKNAPKGNYVFYDGPPFATGLPHYGHILGSTAKDVIGRYQTMQGFRVPRRWGWDCHGLPIENIVEKDLGISGHVEIENLGVEKFVEHARSKVLTYVSEWKKTVDRIGRWVDFDGGYKTMDNTFIESVWWALGELHKKGLLYEGVRVLAYCPRCETPIAKSEIAMDNSYKDISDLTVYAKFELVDEPGTFLIAWTTTPWSLPGNTAIAVNGEAVYVKVKLENEYFIVAKDRAEAVFKDKTYEVVEEFPGSTIVGKKYIPPFDYFANDEKILSNPKSWTVVAADFVTTTDGTGIAHEAPAFGEDDANLAKKENLPFLIHVTPEGKFTDAVKDFAGMPIKPKSSEKDGHMIADIEIIKYLAAKGLLFKKEKIVHSYPHCYRCETPLFYYALPSWFINIQNVKQHMLEAAKEMEWIPSHLKDGRFKNTMESAPDWTISRNRYWASPLPIWKSEEGQLLFVNSINDLKAKIKKSGNRYFVMRHGQAANNIAHEWARTHSYNPDLTEEGKKQVVENAKMFDHSIDLVIASPLERTKQTTRLVCETIGCSYDDVIFDDRIREWDIDSYFEGMPMKEFRQYVDHDYVYDTDRRFSDGENFSQLVDRVAAFLYDVENKYSGKNILIIGHGGALRAMSFITEGFSYKTLPELNERFTNFKNAEVRELLFVPLPHNKHYELDLHRPYIDDITLVDEKGVLYKRIPEVIDCWFESGSMPFAQDHYMGNNPSWKEHNFPAGFVAEYIAQTRTWFYYTHAISTILFGQAPFEHVVTTGTLLAEDGQKMSKSKGNFPDPWILFDKYGVDPLRLYLMSSPLMKGEDANFSEKTVADIASKIIGRLNNVLSFYELYRDVSVEQSKNVSPTNVLDVWIIARLNQLISEVTKGMEAYDMAEATRPFELFVDDLSTWYLRRSRDRIKDGEGEAKQTLYIVLKTVATMLAPFAPFTAEDIWRRLKTEGDTESVHLTEWPKELGVDDFVIEYMSWTRQFVTLGLEQRQKANIKVRQPLSKIIISTAGFEGKQVVFPDNFSEYIPLIKDELNVHEVSLDSTLPAHTVVLDLILTLELKKEGEYRELVRAVQDLRKKAGLIPSDVIRLLLSTTIQGEDMIRTFEEKIMETTGTKDLVMQPGITGETVAFDDYTVTFSLEKI